MVIRNTKLEHYCIEFGLGKYIYGYSGSLYGINQVLAFLNVLLNDYGDKISSVEVSPSTSPGWYYISVYLPD